MGTYEEWRERAWKAEERVRELEADGERIDWLESNGYGVGFFDSPDERPSEWFVCEEYAFGQIASAPTLRGAIDAARRGEG